MAQQRWTRQRDGIGGWGLPPPNVPESCAVAGGPFYMYMCAKIHAAMRRAYS
jgi:hypothetical protein